eukprot:1207412-Pyramimonas_sp.AAC.1
MSDAKHSLVAERVFKWIDQQLDALGVRCAIIIGGDVNSGLGIHRDDDGTMQRTISVTLGGKNLCCENENGRAYREFCYKNGLAV